jgi:hypothetical protein
LPFSAVGTLGAGVVGGAGDPLAQFGHGEVGNGPVAGVVLAIDHQRLQHRLGVGGVGQVAQVRGRAAVGGERILHRHQHARHGALAAGHRGIGQRHVGDVGVVAEPGVVAGHQHAVLRQVDVEFERIGTGVGRRFVGGAGLFRIQPRQSPVGNDERRLAVERGQGRGRGRRGRCGRGRRCRRQHRECDAVAAPTGGDHEAATNGRKGCANRAGGRCRDVVVGHVRSWSGCSERGRRPPDARSGP